MTRCRLDAGAPGGRDRGRLVIVSLLALLPGCSSPEPVVYHRPSSEDKAARAAFVESHPDLPPAVKQQLLEFQTTPETALRRVEYIRTHPGLPQSVKQQILTGNVRLHMKAEHVRAAWGEPEQEESRGGLERWVYSWYSRSAPDRKLEIFLRDGEVVTVRNL